MPEIHKYYCTNCNSEINESDLKCKNCNSSLGPEGSYSVKKIKSSKTQSIKQTKLDELKENLRLEEETPFYANNDGTPSILCIIFIVFTGILLGIIILIIYKNLKKSNLKKKIAEIEKKDKW